MKKKYLYVSAPLLGTIAFFFIYLGARKEYDAKEDAVVQQARQVKEKKLQEEAKNREIAVKSALEQQDKRRAAKKLQEEKDAKDAEARAQAIQTRQKAGRDAEKLEAQTKRLLREIEDEKKEVAKFEADKQHFLEEKVFLEQYVKAAETNVKGLTAVLEKIVDADKKWEDAQKEAARAAAAAAKK